MPWLSPTEQRSPLHRQQLLLLAELLKLTSRVTLARQILILVEDPNMSTDRLRRTLIVTGNADDPNPSSFAVCDGRADFRSRGVEHADERDEGETLLETGVICTAL